MKALKVCINQECPACRKKIAHKEAEAYCSLCGQPLAYICKDCSTQLPNGDEKYCVRCKANHEDKADRRRKIVGGAGAGIAATAAFVATNSKKVLEIVKIIKP